MRLAQYMGIVLFALIVASPFIKAQSDSVDPAFTKAREARDKAIREGDVDVYDRYTTDKFEVTTPDGKMRLLPEQNKRIAAAKQAPAEGVPPAREDEKIDVYPGTIVLNWRQHMQGKDANFTEVWVKNRGTWKCASAHASFGQQQ